MPQSSTNYIFRAVRDSYLEFFILLVLWMLYVSETKTNEILAGVAAALIATVADAVLKAERFARFRPRFRWLLLIIWEVWYTISGTWAIMAALLQRILGRKSEAQFKAVKFQVGGGDAESWARRALVTVYATIPPNFIVVGIDRQRGLVLVHQVSPTGIPEIAKQLGASE